MRAGPPAGIYDPTDTGRVLFAFFAAVAEIERENIREPTPTASSPTEQIAAGILGILLH